jgi:hypothetical protein
MARTIGQIVQISQPLLRGLNCARSARQGNCASAAYIQLGTIDRNDSPICIKSLVVDAFNLDAVNVLAAIASSNLFKGGALKVVFCQKWFHNQLPLKEIARESYHAGFEPSARYRTFGGVSA